MLNFFRNPCNIYILLSILYSIQGEIINTGGTIISKFMFLLIIVIGVYCTIKVMLLKSKPIYFNGLNMLFCLFAFYGILLLLSNHHYVIKAIDYNDSVNNNAFLKSILLSLPTIYAFYYFSIKNYLTEEILKRWLFVLFATSIFRYFDSYFYALNNSDLVDGITNNKGYLFVALIPSLALLKNKPYLQYTLLIVCMAFILFAMKRGAIFTGIVLILYFMYYNRKRIGKTSPARLLLLSIFVLISGYLIFRFLLNNSNAFVGRIEATLSGDDSGRHELYTTFYNYFLNERNLFRIIFGNGANATLGIGDNYAHNDWLEIAINQGVLGLCVYLYYWWCFYRTVKSIKIYDTTKLILSLTFISYFLTTIFSMSYTGYNVIASSIFGYALARCHERRSLH